MIVFRKWFRKCLNHFVQIPLCASQHQVKLTRLEQVDTLNLFTEAIRKLTLSTDNVVANPISSDVFHVVSPESQGTYYPLDAREGRRFVIT